MTLAPFTRRCLLAVSLVLSACSRAPSDAEPGSSAGGSGASGGGGSGPPVALDPDLGLTWSAVDTGTNQHLLDVVWTGTRLFAVGTGGTVLSSPDGLSWTSLPSDQLVASLRHVIWTGSRLVANNAIGEILTSETGTSWTVRFSRPDAPVGVLGKVGSTIVALGLQGQDYAVVSSNGVDWTVRDHIDASINFRACAWGGPKLVCVGSRYIVDTSPQGQPIDSSQGAAYETTDGVRWTDVSPDFRCGPIHAAGWKGDELVAVGSLGAVLLRTAEGGWLYKSSWAPLDTPGGTDDAYAVAWTGKLAVAVGEILITSATAHPYSWKDTGGATGLAIAFTGRRLVVVGPDGSSFVSPAAPSGPPRPDAAVPRDTSPPDAPQRRDAAGAGGSGGGTGGLRFDAAAGVGGSGGGTGGLRFDAAAGAGGQDASADLAPDVGGNLSPDAPQICVTAMPGAFMNTPIANQTGRFTVRFSTTPSASPSNCFVALSMGPQTGLAGYAATVRLNPMGMIDAVNGGAYQAVSGVPYVAGSTYSFRMTVDVPAHTYSVYVTPPGGAEVIVGTNFGFRTGQTTVSSLSSWGVTMQSAAAGTAKVCGFAIE